MQITTPEQDAIVIEAMKRDMQHASEEFDRLEAKTTLTEGEKEDLEDMGELYRAARTILRYYLTHDEQEKLGI